MTAIIYRNGEEINRIVADEAFTAQYCAENGYTYEMRPDPSPEPDPEPESTYTADDLFFALLGTRSTK